MSAPHLDRLFLRASQIGLSHLFEHAGHQPLSRGELLLLAAMEIVMSKLDDVLARVQAEVTVEGSIQTLLEAQTQERDDLRAKVAELQAELAANQQDTSKVDAILASLDSADSLLNASRRLLTNAVTTPGSGNVGSAGDDTVSAAEGNDTTTTQPSGGDTTSAAAGDDTISSGAQGSGATSDTLSGGQGDDSITTDTQTAPAGDDTVSAAAGNDTLTGGQGADSIG